MVIYYIYLGSWGLDNNLRPSSPYNWSPYCLLLDPGLVSLWHQSRARDSFTSTTGKQETFQRYRYHTKSLSFRLWISHEKDIYLIHWHIFWVLHNKTENAYMANNNNNLSPQNQFSVTPLFILFFSNWLPGKGIKRKGIQQPTPYHCWEWYKTLPLYFCFLHPTQYVKGQVALY